MKTPTLPATIEDVPDEIEYLRVRNWEKYQVYKDGRPMKFFRVETSILDDPGFCELADDPACDVFRTMAYAARTGNRIPNNPEWLQAAIHSRVVPDIEKMVNAGFLEPISASVENRTGAYENLPRREEKRRDTEANASVRRDEIWDTLIDELGGNPGEMTRSERGRWNKAAKQLREKNVTPADIRARAAEYRRVWPNVELSPSALVSNWGRMKRAETTRPCPACGVGGGLHLAGCGDAA